MKKLVIILVLIFTSTYYVNAQDRTDGRTTVINGNQNFQLYPTGSYSYMNGDHVAGGGIGIRYNFKRLLVGAEYQYLIGISNYHIDRSFANAHIGVSLVGNPNAKVRPYIIGTIGGASQSAYSCYKSKVEGSSNDFSVDMNLVHTYKTYDWNLQAGLRIQLDFVLSKLLTISVYGGGIYNPFEGNTKWCKLNDVNLKYPSNQSWTIDIKNIDNFTKSDKFGGYAGLSLEFRF